MYVFTKFGDNQLANQNNQSLINLTITGSLILSDNCEAASQCWVATQLAGLHALEVAGEGSGTQIYDAANSTMTVAKIKSLAAGTGITISDNGSGTLTISGSSSFAVASEGSGTPVYDSVNSSLSLAKIKSLVAGANTTITDNGTSITIASTGGSGSTGLTPVPITLEPSVFTDSGYVNATYTLSITSEEAATNCYQITLDTLATGLGSNYQNVLLVIDITDTPIIGAQLNLSVANSWYTNTTDYPNFVGFNVQMNVGPTTDVTQTALIPPFSGINQTKSLTGFIAPLGSESYITIDNQPFILNSQLVSGQAIQIVSTNTIEIDSYFFDISRNPDGSVVAPTVFSNTTNTNSSGYLNYAQTNLQLIPNLDGFPQSANASGAYLSQLHFMVRIEFLSATYVTLTSNTGNAPQVLECLMTDSSGAKYMYRIPYGYKSTDTGNFTGTTNETGWRYGGSVEFVFEQSVISNGSQPFMTIDVSSINNAAITYHITFTPVFGRFVPPPA